MVFINLSVQVIWLLINDCSTECLFSVFSYKNISLWHKGSVQFKKIFSIYTRWSHLKLNCLLHSMRNYEWNTWAHEQFDHTKTTHSVKMNFKVNLVCCMFCTLTSTGSALSDIMSRMPDNAMKSLFISFYITALILFIYYTCT